MKKALLLLFCLMAVTMAEAQDIDRSSRLKKHLYYLASDSLMGRKAGTTGAEAARAYIYDQWQEIGMEPFFKEGFTDPFGKSGVDYANLVGVIPGNDPILKDEYILVGAHFDHIGIKKGEVCNGADDNASGSSALIEIARMLKTSQSSLKRSVIIAAFDAEELGLYGSDHLSERLQVDSLLDKVRCMMSIDMVGWYAKNGQLEILGAGTIEGGKELIESNAGGLNLKVENFETAVLTATDTRGFATKNVPTLHIYTGLKSPYHKPEDDADLIDYEGLDSISCFVARLTGQMAANPDYAASGKIAAIHNSRGKVFEMSVGAGFTSSAIDFRDAAFTGKGGSGWTAGLALQYNSKKNLAFRLGAAYETTESLYPAPADIFNSILIYKQSAIMMPATLILQTKTQLPKFYCGVGIHARYLLDSGIDGIPSATNDMQYGTHFMFGFKAGHFFLEDYFCGQFNKLFDTAAGGPNAGISITTCKIGWVF